MSFFLSMFAPVQLALLGLALSDVPLGVTADKSGVVAAGSMDRRRAYVPLDSKQILQRFRGIWVVYPKDCPADPNMDVRQGRFMKIEQDAIHAPKRSYDLLASFVPAPSHINPNWVERGKPVVQKAKRQKRQLEMLLFVRAAGEASKPLDWQLSITKDGKQLTLIDPSVRREELIRCDPANR